jgi:hypothetical protein
LLFIQIVVYPDCCLSRLLFIQIVVYQRHIDIKSVQLCGHQSWKCYYFVFTMLIYAYVCSQSLTFARWHDVADAVIAKQSSKQSHRSLHMTLLKMANAVKTANTALP